MGASMPIPLSGLRAWWHRRRRAGSTCSTIVPGEQMSEPIYRSLLIPTFSSLATLPPSWINPEFPVLRRRRNRWAGRLITAHAARRPLPPAFRYRHRGDLATIGRQAAVVKLGWFELTGVLGWLFWSVVHIYFLIEARDRFIVAFTWLWDYVTFQRGARLITQVPPTERS
jgi:hypothetical protein